VTVTAVFAALAVSGQALADATNLAVQTQVFDDSNLGFRTALADQETGDTRSAAMRASCRRTTPGRP
jgi:hypothetical protein